MFPLANFYAVHFKQSVSSSSSSLNIILLIDKHILFVTCCLVGFLFFTLTYNRLKRATLTFFWILHTHTHNVDNA